MDEIKIEPGSELQDGFKIGVILELIITLAFVYKFGLKILLIMIPFNVWSLLYVKGDLYRITFTQEKIMFYPKKEKFKLFSWEEIKIIRYEKSDSDD